MISKGWKVRDFRVLSQVKFLLPSVAVVIGGFNLTKTTTDFVTFLNNINESTCKCVVISCQSKKILSALLPNIRYVQLQYTQLHIQ